MVEPITHQYVDVQDEAPDPAVQLQSTREGVAVVLLNRPKRGNAIGSAEVAALTEAFVTLQGAEGVRVVFLRGAQGCFSIGSDPAQMREMLDMPEEDARLHSLQIGQMLHALHAIPALTVALVDGPAVGVGAGLVAACDTGAATRASLFAFADARLGLSPGALTPFLVEAVGARQARRLFAWGHSFDAAEACRIGLVDELVEDAQALDAVQDRLATEALASAPSAVEAAKRLVAHVTGRPLERSVLEDTARRYAQQSSTDDAREGIAAFLEERNPRWFT
ncbi:enoyl-CoA hydratase-related protein [Caulobacter sp. S45]|uniref:enoyl-CoA hydratase-related protein n=1 Tax=Caulobacter sp. S45 TaxID=1641861 RepID=UPI001574F725|nr:enoyl-CoA hydratase-related protein [Caulobacter sp. S45]